MSAQASSGQRRQNATISSPLSLSDALPHRKSLTPQRITLPTSGSTLRVISPRCHGRIGPEVKSPSFETADRARQQHQEVLLGHRHVNGVGTGLRWVGGELTDERCVTVLVTKKRPRSYLPSSQVLPEYVSVDGEQCKVDVVQGGPIRGLGDPEFDPPGPTITGPYRPLENGCEISNANGHGVGTLACIVRDLTDGSLCVLSNNHVLVVDNAGTIGDPIVQPGGGGTVARLKRYIQYPQPPATSSVDAAIATLTDPDLASSNFADDRIPPISAGHPAVGLFFGADPTNGIGVISRIEEIKQALGIDLLDPDASHEVTGADLGAHIEKVGRTTGYTSSKIWAENLTAPIFMSRADGSQALYLFSRLIATTRFGWPGDSGSLVCLGGDGDTRLPLDLGGLQCEVMSSVGSMYDLPLAADEPIADRVRDEFLAQSSTGVLLTQAFYTNQDVILNRTVGVEASNSAKSYAQALYTKYHDFLISALDNKDDPDLVVTEENLEDAQLALVGMRPYFTDEEDAAITSLFIDVMVPMQGMNFQDLLTYMNDPATVQHVLDLLAPVPTLEVPGPFTG